MDSTNRKNQYRKWCSTKCQVSDPECIAESKSTRLVKYGSSSYSGVDKARLTETCTINSDFDMVTATRQTISTLKTRNAICALTSRNINSKINSKNSILASLKSKNMKDNGYCRIFDCGNMVFEKYTEN